MKAPVTFAEGVGELPPMKLIRGPSIRIAEPLPLAAIGTCRHNSLVRKGSKVWAFEWRQKCQRTLVILRIIAVAVDNLLAFALVRVFDQSREMREALLRLVKCDLNTSGPRARPEHYR